MIDVLDFNEKHIEAAGRLALMNYSEEKAIVTELPTIDKFPDLMPFVKNGLGVVAFYDDEMIGFLCWYNPWDKAFKSTAKGTFSPIHAHGTIKENRGMIYRRLYQSAAEKLIKHKVTYHAIGLYAHDVEAITSLFSYGFGLRCIDAIRTMDNFKYNKNKDVNCCELPKSEVIQVREMRHMLSEHLGLSPCFMCSSPQDFSSWIARAEKRDSRVFVTKVGKQPISFIEITNGGENFATETSDMLNICGAFCLPEFRGSGVIQSLLNYVITILKSEGCRKLGVDFESFNPTASGFWLKYFTAYTNSVVRRIDECAINI